MKYFEVCRHPSGDILVRNEAGQERWLKAGTFEYNKDGTVSPKQNSVLTPDKK